MSVKSRPERPALGDDTTVDDTTVDDLTVDDLIVDDTTVDDTTVHVTVDDVVVDDSDVETPTPTARTPAPARPSWRRPGWRTLVTLAVVAVALALAGALVVSTVTLRADSSLTQARATALTSARSYAVELGGYDYRHLEHDFGVVTANSTPSFRRSFTQSSNALKSTLERYHAVASAKVVAAGLVSATPSHAVALVFLQQRITNTTRSAPTTDRSQVEVSLVRSGGRWLIDQVILL
jgi:Mce-associated membrane protein